MNDKEESIQQAIAAYNEGEFQTYAEAAKAFGISESTLY
jgi:transposase